jgi:hypothetical protein
VLGGGVCRPRANLLFLSDAHRRARRFVQMQAPARHCCQRRLVWRQVTAAISGSTSGALAGPDNAGYRWLGRPTFRQLKSSAAQLSPAHFLREGDELVEAFAPMVVEAHVRVRFLAPSSSPWIAIAVYFVPAPCGSSRITAVRSSMPAAFCGTPAAFCGR